MITTSVCENVVQWKFRAKVADTKMIKSEGK